MILIQFCTEVSGVVTNAEEKVIQRGELISIKGLAD